MKDTCNHSADNSLKADGFACHDECNTSPFTAVGKSWPQQYFIHVGKSLIHSKTLPIYIRAAVHNTVTTGGRRQSRSKHPCDTCTRQTTLV